LENNIQIDENVFIAANKGYMDVGDHVHIGGGSHLNCNGGVDISDFCGLSQCVKIYSVTDDYTGKFLTNPTIPETYKNLKKAPVHFGCHVLIGAGSVVMTGVSIGDGSAIGALSLVSMSLDEWGIYFGAPAKKIKTRSKKLLELEQQLLKEEKKTNIDYKC
jgi:galactoside O-acetyltransferase